MPRALALLGAAAMLALSSTTLSASPIRAQAAGSTNLPGTAWAWDYNYNGTLGNGTNTSSTSPVAVSLPSGTTVTAISAGSEQSLALTSTGGVLAWGNNSYRQLGNGSTNNSNTPVAVSLPSGTTVTAIAGGGNHSLALTPTGQVLAWGFNYTGQLGNGTTTDSSTPGCGQPPLGNHRDCHRRGQRPQPALARRPSQY